MPVPVLRPSVVSAAYAAWNEARRALSLRESQLAEARTQEEFLRYQLEELRKAVLKPGEEDQLLANRDRVQPRSVGIASSEIRWWYRGSWFGTHPHRLCRLRPVALQNWCSGSSPRRRALQEVSREVDTLSNAPLI